MFLSPLSKLNPNPISDMLLLLLLQVLSSPGPVLRWVAQLTGGCPPFSPHGPWARPVSTGACPGPPTSPTCAPCQPPPPQHVPHHHHHNHVPHHHHVHHINHINPHHHHHVQVHHGLHQPMHLLKVKQNRSKLNSASSSYLLYL